MSTHRSKRLRTTPPWLRVPVIDPLTPCPIGEAIKIPIATPTSVKPFARAIGSFPARSTHAKRVLLRPAAFLKLMFCCHAAATEIGGFGIGSEHDPLTLESFVLVRQTASPVTVEFEDAAVADHVDSFADQGIGPERSMRVWIHTHPGSSAAPSGTDERTFARSFGGCDWSAMLIQSRATQTYCRLQFTAGPGGEVVVPVEWDWASLPTWLVENADALPALIRGWEAELLENVKEETRFPIWRPGNLAFDGTEDVLGGNLDRQDLAELLEGYGYDRHRDAGERDDGDEIVDAEGGLDVERDHDFC